MSKEVTRYDLRVTDDGAGLYATDEPNTRGMQYVSALDYESLLAERDALAEKVEKVRSRCVSVSSAPDAVIPNALDAWGRPVKQHLPYDFSGNPGASATQYCNGWNDSGSYWKAHCVDIQVERDALREAIAQAVEYLDVSRLEQIASGSIIHQRMRAALQGEQP